jgi:hypothetical protein
MTKIIVSIIFLASLSNFANALPIDWNGSFGVDTTLIDNYRKVKMPMKAHGSIRSLV